MRDADSTSGRAGASGDAFLETYRAHLGTRGVALEELHPDESGTIRSRLRDAAPSDLPELSGFAVGEALGRGAMGLVSAAWQHSLGREVAVKSLRGPDHRPADHATLVHEARITGQLEHPNVVPIHDLGRTAAGAPIFAMKRVDGRAWAEWLSEPSPEQLARVEAAGGHLAFHVEVLIQVCNAVGFAHSKGILHRDLKPQNVMIGHFGEVYLVDWGIAARVSELGGGDPELVGTPAYMAPEMAAGAPLSVQSDLYQLGAILFELVAGTPPRPKATAIKTMAVAWSGVLLPIPRGCPDGLAAIILRALAPDPAERHPSAAALQAELRAWLRDRPLLAVAAEARQRAHAAVAGLRSPPADAEPRSLVRAARDALAGLEPLRANLRDPSLDALRHEVLSALLAFEVGRGRAGAAEAVLHDLGDAATDAQRSAVDEVVRVEAARAAELARLRDQQDWTWGSRQRRRYTALLGVMQLVIYPTFGVIEVFWLNGPIPLPIGWATIFGIPSLAALAVVLMRSTGPSLDTLGARTQRAIALMVVAANLVFLTSLAIGLDLQQAFFFTLSVGLAVPLAIQGVFTTPRLYPPAALFALTGLATLLAPRLYTFFVMPVGVGLAHLAAYWTDHAELPGSEAPDEGGPRPSGRR